MAPRDRHDKPPPVAKGCHITMDSSTLNRKQVKHQCWWTTDRYCDRLKPPSHNMRCGYSYNDTWRRPVIFVVSKRFTKHHHTLHHSFTSNFHRSFINILQQSSTSHNDWFLGDTVNDTYKTDLGSVKQFAINLIKKTVKHCVCLQLMYAPYVLQK